MDVFSLTETEFFRMLTEGKNDNLHIAYKDFVLQVSEICRTAQDKTFAISALLYAEVEIAHIQTDAMRNEVNNHLASFITKALTLVRRTISHIKEVSIKSVPIEDSIDNITLNWEAKKSALVELGYAFKVANCFGVNVTVKEIIGKLAKVFNVTIPDNYIYKKYNEMRVRSRNSRTYFIDSLTMSLNNFMARQDEEN